MFITTAVAEVH